MKSYVHDWNVSSMSGTAFSWINVMSMNEISFPWKKCHSHERHFIFMKWHVISDVWGCIRPSGLEKTNWAWILLLNYKFGPISFDGVHVKHHLKQEHLCSLLLLKYIYIYKVHLAHILLSLFMMCYYMCLYLCTTFFVNIMLPACRASDSLGS